MEIWKDVVGYEGYYEVSDIGNVKNSRSGHILSPGLSQGYKYVVLCKHGERHNKQINRLVAEAFLENPEHHPIVNHKNEIKTDNVVDNLEWCTYSYNNSYGSAPLHKSESLRGKPTWNKGKRMSDDYRRRVSEGMRKYHRIKKENT